MTDWVWQSGDAIADDIAWLESLGASANGGWEPRSGAFEDDIWVLHPMYENITPNVKRGATPGARVLWGELWRRNGVTLGEGMVHPPGIMWIVGPGAEFQKDGVFAHENLYEPEEGTLDSETLAQLVPRLPEGSGPIHAVWDVLAAARVPRGAVRSDVYEHIGVHATLDQILDVTAPPGGWLHTPSNFWPEDRSWLVFTDYDLWATRVYGTAELIASLEEAPDLETLRWSPPT